MTRTRIVSVLTFGAMLGCAPEANHFPPPPPPPPCTTGCGYVGTHIRGPSGGPGAGGGDAGAGAEEAIKVTGKVGVAVTAELDKIESYSGAGTVFGPGLMGKTVSAPFGGAGSSFTLDGVLAGSDWLYVEDNTTGGTGVLSTFSPHVLPAAGELVVPVLDQALMESIAQSQPGGLSLDAARAQIVLALRRGGKPVSGVSITGSAGAGLVAYDQGAGNYSSALKATGSAGGVVILNVQAPSLGGGLSLHLTDAAAHAYTVEIPVAPGVATVGQIEL